LIGGFKFQNLYGAYAPLAELLADSLDELPAETVIVPVPTVRAHIRERGYDHTLLIARHIAKQRHLKVSQVLHRATNTKQRGVGRTDRMAQAKVAFQVKDRLEDNRPYLLIDDIVTTGATMHYAALALRGAGAKVVWVAAIARQPLD
jgi:ComF family protein